MEYVKEVKTIEIIDNDLNSIGNIKSRNFRQKYKSIENLIKLNKIDTTTLNYIIKECYNYNLSLNQTAVVLAQAYAESGLKPNITNKYGFHGLWQFSKRQAKHFNLYNSLEKQTTYLMEEVAQKNKPEDYNSKWITWHKDGNGWKSKCKQTWDTSDDLYELNYAFSYGWERFAVEGKGQSENQTRYELAQMFREYLSQNGIQ